MGSVYSKTHTIGGKCIYLTTVVKQKKRFLNLVLVLFRFPGVPSEIQEENGIRFEFQVFKKKMWPCWLELLLHSGHTVMNSCNFIMQHTSVEYSWLAVKWSRDVEGHTLTHSWLLHFSDSMNLFTILFNGNGEIPQLFPFFFTFTEPLLVSDSNSLLLQTTVE